MAERLEYLLNQLVIRAEADMVASIDASEAAYAQSRWIVIGFALTSIAWLFSAGYTPSLVSNRPATDKIQRFAQLAAGDFPSDSKYRIAMS